MFTLNIYIFKTTFPFPKNYKAKNHPYVKLCVCFFFLIPLINLNPFNPQWIFANKVKEILLPHGYIEFRVFLLLSTIIGLTPNARTTILIFFINALHILFLYVQLTRAWTTSFSHYLPTPIFNNHDRKCIVCFKSNYWA
jgi:hypothetical protein